MNSSQQGKADRLVKSDSAEKGSIAKKPMSNLLMRFITGVIIAFFTLIVTFLDGLVFCFFCLGVGAAILYEWNNITSALQTMQARFCTWGFFLLLSYVLLVAASPLYILAVLAGGACLSYAIAWLEKGGKAAAFQSAGFVYAGLFPAGFAFLRDGLAHGVITGLYWVLFLYITVWASDIGAYICGRICGGPKLAPGISPNKTWSGAIGGIIFAVFGALCFTYAARQEVILEKGASIMAYFIPYSLIIAAAFLLSFIAQCGDLAESLFKRRFGVKDSGRLLPGHGGIMDRVDGLLPACIAFICLLMVTGWGFP